MSNKFDQILHIGILGAMKEEIGQLEDHLNNKSKINYGDLTIISGEFFLNQKSPKLSIDLVQLEKYSNDQVLKHVHYCIFL